ncbi:hypothetical protein QFZ68_000165 [Streptomyces sp. V1I6]|nr:hypothetical protein [Streptomyces sp. V1I6]
MASAPLRSLAFQLPFVAWSAREPFRPVAGAGSRRSGLHVGWAARTWPGTGQAARSRIQIRSTVRRLMPTAAVAARARALESPAAGGSRISPMEDERPDVLTIGQLAHRTGLPAAHRAAASRQQPRASHRHPLRRPSDRSDTVQQRPQPAAATEARTRERPNRTPPRRPRIGAACWWSASAGPPAQPARLRRPGFIRAARRSPRGSAPVPGRFGPGPRSQPGGEAGTGAGRRRGL